MMLSPTRNGDAASALRKFAHWHIAVLAIMLAAIVILNIQPYNWHVTSMFAIDHSIADAYPQPAGTVVLSGPGYDGQEYWQMARNMPKLLSPAHWNDVNALPPGPYAHQRFLLPLLAFALSLGNDAALPYVFLLLNILSLLGTAYLMTKIAAGKKFYGLLIAVCPAAMVGLHFMLAEPLNLFLITFFLYRYTRDEKIDLTNAIVLSLCALTREINLVFILGTLGYSLLKGQWRDALWMIVPLGTFVALHTFIYAVFHQIPFLWSAEKSNLPLVAIWELLSGQKGYNAYTLSSIALFLAFVLPTFVIAGYKIIQSKRLEFVPLMLVGFLALMLIMPDHIWGSITSIGRVITPVYPLFFVWAARRDGLLEHTLAIGIGMIGVVAAVGLALSTHPYSLV